MDSQRISRMVHDWILQQMDFAWGSRFEWAFFDVKVFNPYAPSNQKTPLSACYCSHENEKKRKYDQRIREVKHATFTSLILSCTGGLGWASSHSKL